MLTLFVLHAIGLVPVFVSFFYASAQLDEIVENIGEIRNITYLEALCSEV